MRRFSFRLQTWSFVTISAFLVGCASKPVVVDPNRTASDIHGVMRIHLVSDWTDSTDTDDSFIKKAQSKTAQPDSGVRALRRLSVPNRGSFCWFKALRYTPNEHGYFWNEMQMAQVLDANMIHSQLTDDIGSFLDQGIAVDALYRKADRAENVSAKRFTATGFPAVPGASRDGWMVESHLWFHMSKRVNQTLVIPFSDASQFSLQKSKNFMVAECSIQGSSYDTVIRLQEVYAMLSSIQLK